MLFFVINGLLVVTVSTIWWLYSHNFGHNVDVILRCISGYIVASIFIDKNKRTFTGDELIYIATGSVLISLFISLMSTIAFMSIDNEFAAAFSNILNKLTIRENVVTFGGIFLLQSLIGYWFYHFISKGIANAYLSEPRKENVVR